MSNIAELISCINITQSYNGLLTYFWETSNISIANLIMGTVTGIFATETIVGTWANCLAVFTGESNTSFKSKAHTIVSHEICMRVNSFRQRKDLT